MNINILKQGFLTVVIMPLVSAGLLSGCATPSQTAPEAVGSNDRRVNAAKGIRKFHRNSTCSDPIVIAHTLVGEYKDSQDFKLIPKTERISRLKRLGYDINSVERLTACPSGTVYGYEIPLGPRVVEDLYIRHMTRAAVNADSTIICENKFNRSYISASKPGGAGQYTQSLIGEICSRVQ